MSADSPTADPQLAKTATSGRRRAALISLVMSYAGLGLNMIKSILLVPFYFRYFSLSVYGAWLASANIVALLGLLDMGLATIFYQRLAESFGAKDTARFAKTVGSVLAITLLTTPIFIALGVLAAPLVPPLVNADSAIYSALTTTFALTAAGSAFDLAQTNLIAVTHAWQRTGIGGVSRILVQLAEVLGTVLSLWLGLGVVAFGVGSLAGGLVGITYTAVSTIRGWRQLGLPPPTLERNQLREMMSANIPVFMSRIVAHVASNIEVALVSALVSPAAAAIYGLTDRLFRVALSLINPIAGSVLSALAHLLGEVGTKGVVKPLRDLFTLWSTAAALCFPILLAMNRDFVAIWVGSDKYGGLGLSSAICLSTLLSARSFLMYIVLNGLGEIAITAWVSTFEPALRLPLMVVGIKAFGSMGLPIAATISVGILSFGIYPRYVARKIQLPGREGSALQLRGVSAVAATMLLGGLLAVFAPSVDHWLTFLAKTTIVSIGVMSLALAASRDVRALLWDLQGRVRARFAAAR